MIAPSQNGLELKGTPFIREINEVMSGNGSDQCLHITAEFHVAGEVYIPFTILSYQITRDFIDSFYSLIELEFQLSALHKEVFVKNLNNIEAVIKTYKHPKNAPFAIMNLKDPVIKRYKAKLFLEESDYITQNNPVQNNADVMNNRIMTSIRVQLMEKGLEELISRHVGGTYRNISGYQLMRHLIDYHVNQDNNDVATMITGTDVAPDYMDIYREQIVIEDGNTLLSALSIANVEGGGLWPTGFSYFIHNNIWYIFPPYSLGRWKERTKKMVIVNLPKNRIPGLEKTYNNTDNVLTVVSTRDASVKDKRESKKMTLGTGAIFSSITKLMDGFGKMIGNKLEVDGSQNINAIKLEERADNVQQPRFADQKLTAAKNIELSKFAPSKGFMMRLSWENSEEALVYPGMPVKVLYLESNKPKSAIGVVTGIETVYYPVDQEFPKRKFSSLTYIQVFVGEEPLIQL